MTADPIRALRTILADLHPLIEVSTEVDGNPPRFIRLDEAGGTAQIRNHLDAALVEVQCFDRDATKASELGRQARALLDSRTGTVGDAVVTRITTAPMRRHADSRGRGHVSFPAVVYLHPGPAS